MEASKKMIYVGGLADEVLLDLTGVLVRAVLVNRLSDWRGERVKNCFLKMNQICLHGEMINTTDFIW